MPLFGPKTPLLRPGDRVARPTPAKSGVYTIGEVVAVEWVDGRPAVAIVQWDDGEQYRYPVESLVRVPE